MIKKLMLVFVAIIVVATVLIPVCMSSGEDLAVVVLTGQSNAAYRELNVDLDEVDALGLPEHEVYYYGTNTMPTYYRNSNDDSTVDWTFQTYDIHSMLNDSKTAWKIGSDDAPLAYYMSKKYNCDVLVLNAAVGGAGIGLFLPGHDGARYAEQIIEHALNDVRGLGKNYNSIKVGYVWMQGESNKYTSVADYIEQFDQVNKWYHSKGFYECYLIQTRPTNGGNASTAQLQICQQDPSVILASTAPATFTTENGLLASDNLHYTQEGRIAVMDDVVDAMPDKITNGMNLILVIPVLVLAAIMVMIVGLYGRGGAE